MDGLVLSREGNQYRVITPEGEVVATLLGHVAKVEQRDERPGVRLLGVEDVGVAEHEHVLEGLDAEAVEQAPLGGVAPAERHRGVPPPVAETNAVFAGIVSDTTTLVAFALPVFW